MLVYMSMTLPLRPLVEIATPEPINNFMEYLH
jgi:hypothetical protein